MYTIKTVADKRQAPQKLSKKDKIKGWQIPKVWYNVKAVTERGGGWIGPWKLNKRERKLVKESKRFFWERELNLIKKWVYTSNEERKAFGTWERLTVKAVDI